MSIHVLPAHLRDQIAAGEVIERPASVMKELIENALDAGAQRIRVEVEHAGRQLVRVTDDGAGIAPEDLSLAFEHFATSKIYEARDIESIHTFGFRGEALPSIATVARVHCLTRPRGAPLGTGIRLEGGVVLGMAEAGAPVGTRVEVRDLFYNTPGRRKFLRSLRAELSYMLGVFTTFAIGFPEVAWTLVCDGKPFFELTPAPYRERLLAVYGQEATAQMEAFEGEGLSGRVWGNLSRDPAGGRRAYRLFVNRRAVRNATLYRAASTALAGAGTVILFLEIPPRSVDVNVHPAKREVRFRDEEGVYDLVWSALTRMLTRGRMRAERIAEAEDAYQTAGPSPREQAFRAVGQVENTFVLAYSDGHVYLIDQHAAHERVLYDRLQDAVTRGVPPQRTLVAPQVLLLSLGEWQVLEQHRLQLEACGFAFDRFGPEAVAVRALPDVVPVREAERLCRQLIPRLREAILHRREETVTQAVACLAAIKAGTPLSIEEQGRLLQEWRRSSHPDACAHNRPVYSRIRLDEVRQQIGRTIGNCEPPPDAG